MKRKMTLLPVTGRKLLGLASDCVASRCGSDKPPKARLPIRRKSRREAWPLELDRESMAGLQEGTPLSPLARQRSSAIDNLEVAMSVDWRHATPGQSRNGR